MKNLGVCLGMISVSVFASNVQSEGQISSAVTTTLPKIVDFVKYPTAIHDYFPNFSQEAWSYGRYAFNHAPELIPFFAKLKRDYKTDTLIQTGTFHRGTAVAFSFLFKHVYTIEINENNYKLSQNQLKDLYGDNECSFEYIKDRLPKIFTSYTIEYLIPRSVHSKAKAIIAASALGPERLNS